MHLDRHPVVIHDPLDDTQADPEAPFALIEARIAFENMGQSIRGNPDAGIRNLQPSSSETHTDRPASSVVLDGIGEKIVHHPLNKTAISREGCRCDVGLKSQLF